MAYKEFQKGNKVMTSLGQGVVTRTRPDDGCCEVQLAFGKMYINPRVHAMRKTMTMDELHAAFEALETMRKLNLEVECNDLGIPFDHKECKLCLLAQAHDQVQASKNNNNKSSASFLPSIHIPNPLNSSKKKMEPCLLCANPTCTAKHASKTFQKQKITLCVDCEALFQAKDLTHDTTETALQRQLERLTDAYDRAFLVLRYSSQWIPDLVQQLQAETARDDKVTLGTSSVGVVSSAMGLAGAATLLTPAGPPLLLASLVFGTGNAAVGLGYSAHKHLGASNNNSPTAVANRLLALYGCLQAAMERIVTLREQVHAHPALGNVVTMSSSTLSSSSSTKPPPPRNAYLQALSQGISATKTSNSTLRVTNAAGYTTSASLFDAMGAAPLVGQAFSAAMMVVDYQTASATLTKMQRGSVNEKAQTLQQACAWSALVQLPTTADLEGEVRDILRAASCRPLTLAPTSLSPQPASCRV